MKTQTTLAALAAMAIGTATSQAELTFSAPGADSAIGTSNGGSLTINAGEHKSYQVTACQFVAGNTNNGFDVTVRYGGTVIASHTFTKHGGATTVNVSMDEITGTDAVFTLEYGTGEAPKNGVSVDLIATVVDTTIAPTGTLDAPLLSKADEEERPNLNWMISKLMVEKSPEGAPVVTPGGGDDGGSDEDADNVGNGKSNNGHGNNQDGIDISNPGKSAEKWAENGHNDTDYDGDGVIEDDESKGGGSAIGQSKVQNSPSE